MALFGKKKTENTETKDEVATKDSAVKGVTTDKEKKDESKKEAKQAPEKLSAGRDLASVIIRPRITEKAVLGGENDVYTFEVHPDATKTDIKAAVVEYYKVTPVKINIVNKKPRHYMARMRGRKMMASGMKKAYIYLKKGDRIELV